MRFEVDVCSCPCTLFHKLTCSFQQVTIYTLPDKNKKKVASQIIGIQQEDGK